MNSHRVSAEAAAEEAAAAVAAASTASCFWLWRLEMDNKESRSDAREEAALSAMEWGWKTGDFEVHCSSMWDKVEGDAWV